MNLKELLRQISSHPDYLQASSIQSEATKFTSRQTLPDLKTMISDLSKLTYGTCLESEEVNYILDTFSPLLEKSDKITKIIISCIGNICVGTKLPILQRIIKILSTKLFNETDTTILVVTLKSLSVVFNENSRISNDGTMNMLSRIEQLAFPEDLAPKSNTLASYSEDDSMSDGDFITKPVKKQSRILPEWKIQIQALACIESLTKQSPKQMSSHWSKYLPSNLETRKSLMYIILVHPSDSVRQVACQVVISFFSGAKQYLSIASHANRESSFTSLSQSLADQIYVTIYILLQCLRQSNGSPTTTNLYSLLNTILLSCNLRNLKGDFGLTIFDTLQQHVSFSDKPKYLILECLSSLLGHLEYMKPQLDQILEIILENSDTIETAEMVAVLNLVGAMANFFPEYLWSTWIKSSPVLLSSFTSKNHGEILAGLRALEKFIAAAGKKETLTLPKEWWISTLKSTGHLWMNDNHGIRCVSCHILGHMPPLISDFIDPTDRKTIIVTVLALAQDENADVRAAACGTIGALSYYPWIRSDITILSGFAKRLPGLCDDTNLKVRIRAFWAVGSLVDALRSRTEDVESKLNAIEIKGNLNAIDVAHSDSERTAETMRGIFDLSTDLKLNLLRSMIAGCRDQEKVRSHAFRALGRIIDLIPGDELAKMGDSLDGALNALVSNLTSGPIKNRWNACHCLKSLFGYPGFPLGTNVAYTKPLFKSLVEVSSSSTNFKVKTGAILALTSVASLDRFETPQDTAENLILMILRGLIETVKSIDVVFIRATLEEQTYQFQLCDALSNLVNHLRVICSSSWTEEMHSLAIEISGLVGTVGKSKTSFDPHGL